MKIRQAAAGDAQFITECNILMALETEHRHLDEATVLRGVRMALQRPEVCRYFLAELDGRLAGQCMVTYEWSDWRAGMLWWIQSVYVQRSFRRRGVLRALYTHVERLARRSGEACGLRLYVDSDNGVARRAYERLGMNRCRYEIYEHDWSAAGPQGAPQP